ncbi:hypothetical protein LCGC14_1678560 [marine sediment metagenome]|uniref:Uncharacterized protein n=1 Tax=marine sediment metagenome TaxID=412755 RepID=A0A0F9HPU0_9ZZZZ
MTLKNLIKEVERLKSIKKKYGGGTIRNYAVTKLRGIKQTVEAVDNIIEEFTVFNERDEWEELKCLLQIK